LFSQSTGFHSFTKTILRLRPNTLLVRNYQAKHDVSSAESSKYFIPSEQIDALKESVDLVSVIESYDLPKFKRTGDNRATCVCPFHDDTNPSLSIDGNRGIFKCFSCGVGGNVYSFLREYSKLEGEDIGFYKAVKLVNEKYANGFSLNLANTAYGKSPKNMEEYKMEQAKKQRILQANLIAAAFFEENLSLPGAGQARSHLRKRGINPNTVRAFSVGFAPECYFQRNISYDTTTWGKGSLVNHLKDKNFTAQEIFDAGLATRIKGKNNKNKQAKQDDNSAELDYSNLMDRFRGRIVIPIFDATGSKVLGFGGRILENPDEISDFKAAKYLNSPESPVFSKKNILFGQSMAKKSVKFWADQDSDISRPVIIVEGYMDAIALWQAGVREAVASMGTALTFKQLEAAAAIAGSRNGMLNLFQILDGMH
jgi:DNA primase